MEDFSENEQLRQQAPTLFGLPKNDPFNVPDGFFHRFPQGVQTKLSAKPRRLAPVWIKRMAIALPLVALAAFGIRSLLHPDQADPFNISPEEAAYMASTWDISDTQAILASSSGTEWPAFDSVTVQLSPDEALAYVDRENIDLTELITNP